MAFCSFLCFQFPQAKVALSNLDLTGLTFNKNQVKKSPIHQTQTLTEIHLADHAFCFWSPRWDFSLNCDQCCVLWFVVCFCAVPVLSLSPEAWLAQSQACISCTHPIQQNVFPLCQILIWSQFFFQASTSPNTCPHFNSIKHPSVFNLLFSVKWYNLIYLQQSSSHKIISEHNSFHTI